MHDELAFAPPFTATYTAGTPDAAYPTMEQQMSDRELADEIVRLHRRLAEALAESERRNREAVAGAIRSKER